MERWEFCIDLSNFSRKARVPVPGSQVSVWCGSQRPMPDMLASGLTIQSRPRPCPALSLAHPPEKENTSLANGTWIALVPTSVEHAIEVFHTLCLQALVRDWKTAALTCCQSDTMLYHNIFSASAAKSTNLQLQWDGRQDTRHHCR